MKQTDITYTIPQQPRQLRIDSTSKCNASCLSCHRSLTKRDGRMPSSLLIELLDDVSKWETPLAEIIPVNYGEFFMRKDWGGILQMIEYKLPRTQITLPTNGSQMDEKTIEALCAVSTLKIVNFSVNAYFEDTYEQFMGLPFETVKTIETAIKRIHTERPDIQSWVSMVHDPVYSTDLERDLFKNHWGQFLLDLGIPEKELVNRVWVIPAASAGRDKEPINPVKLPCRSIFDTIVVGYDGKISSCCWDSNFSLDLSSYKGTLLDNWHSPEMNELRKIHNEHGRENIDLCGGCTFG